MNNMYVTPETVMKDFGVSKPKAYSIIQNLNQELKKLHPTAIVVAGKVNRIWYDQACLRQPRGEPKSQDPADKPGVSRLSDVTVNENGLLKSP